MHELFLLCRDCRVVHRVYPADELAEGAIVSDSAATAHGEFLFEHHRHRLDRVERCRGAECHRGALWDPMRVSLIELTDGHEVFTVRGGRDSIEEARQYEVVTQRIETTTARVTVAEAEVRRALDRHFYPYALRPTKVDHFLLVIRAVVATVSSESLETVFDDGNDPAVGIARFPDEDCVTLLEHCIGVFDAWEFSRVASFISANRDEYGALALRVRDICAVQPPREGISAGGMTGVRLVHQR